MNFDDAPARNVPEWVADDRASKGLCEHCGHQGVAHITWADGRRHPRREEILCRTCWDQAAA